MSAYIPPPVPGPSPLESGSILTGKYDAGYVTTGRLSGMGINKLPVQHPNGSEGWLPTVQDAQPSSNLTTAAPDALTSRIRSSEPLSQHTESEGTILQAGTHNQNVSGRPQRSSAVIYRKSTLSQLAKTTSRRPVSEAQSLPNSAFAGGAGTGPLASPEDDTQRCSRIIETHRNLTPAQKPKIAREESFYKRISMTIREEAKTEKQALSVAIDELENMQKYQRNGVENESRIQSSHVEILNDFKKKEAIYLNAKRRYESALAKLNSASETLDTLRARSRATTKRMQDKSAEIDNLRETLAVHNREREVRLAQLNRTRSRSFWCF